jgi:hypothetical protein
MHTTLLGLYDPLVLDAAVSMLPQYKMELRDVRLVTPAAPEAGRIHRTAARGYCSVFAPFYGDVLRRHIRAEL